MVRCRDVDGIDVFPGEDFTKILVSLCLPSREVDGLLEIGSVDIADRHDVDVFHPMENLQTMTAFPPHPDGGQSDAFVCAFGR